jgi:tetratricopeptide (TPR) repeat protein
VRALGWAILTMVLVAGNAHAGDRENKARALFDEGRQLFQQEKFQPALDRFKSAYLISQEPALLYNMASALQGLNRPHDAAEELRAYLRALPDDPERSLIEGKIRALEESQRLIDAELLKNPATLRALPPPPPRWPRKRVVTLVVGVLAAALVIAGGSVGIWAALRPPDYTASTLMAHPVTP